MAALADVRRLALALPGVEEVTVGHLGGPGWRTKAGLVAWERGPHGRDLEQLAALGREWPGGEIVAIRTEDMPTVAALVEEDPATFFTIPHFDGFSAVLVRLDAIDVDRLGELIADAWLTRAPKRVAAAWLEEHPAG